jgi:hypothetical protein
MEVGMQYDENQCPLCKQGATSNIAPYGEHFAYEYHCERCGGFRIPKFALLKLGSDVDLYLLSGYTREMSGRGSMVTLKEDNIQDIKDQAPRTVLERSDRLFRSLALLTRRPGGSIRLTLEKDYPLAYAPSGQEFAFLLDHLGSLGYVDTKNRDSEKWPIMITPKGWIELESRMARNLDSAKVFVAMAFDPQLRLAYDDAIKPAIEACGYKSLRIDGVDFLGPIADAIIGHIRESRFVIADMTLHKGGMYFEGGFAMGLGLPVIWTCRKDEVDKVHFDTRHYNHLTWDREVDLRENLERRIRATIGLVVCSPKTGPCGMRVSEAPRGQETNREATHG